MMSANIECKLNGKRSIYIPEIDFNGIEECKKDVMIDINQGITSRICRSCGKQRFCDCCSEPIKWDCERCWSMYDVTHSHIGNFNFSGHRAINEFSI